MDGYSDGVEATHAQYIDLKHSHAELLKALNEIKEASTGGVINQEWLKDFVEAEIQKANQITK